MTRPVVVDADDLYWSLEWMPPLTTATHPRLTRLRAALDADPEALRERIAKALQDHIDEKGYLYQDMADAVLSVLSEEPTP